MPAVRKTSKPKVWALTSFFNDYEHHRGYLEKIYFTHPSRELFEADTGETLTDEAWCLVCLGARYPGREDNPEQTPIHISHRLTVYEKPS